MGFARFYARRCRRLLPAAAVVLVVTALVFTALASPVEATAGEGGFRASFLYVANWYFIDQAADYFGADLTASPVLHFWSLAVEEQFYLAWPLLLGGLYALTRRLFPARQAAALRAVVAAGALASVLWAWTLRTSDPTRAYYGTDTRAYQLMAGALIALTPGLLARIAHGATAARWVGLGAITALGVTASSWVGLDPVERGIAVTAITATLIVSLETARSGILHHALSTDPIVYLGKISYGTYLWHWPVLIVLNRSYDLAVPTTIALTTLIATALASLSYQLLEHPIRISAFLDRHRTPVIATGLALSITAAFTIIPTIIDNTTTTAAPSAGNLATTGFTPIPTDLDLNTIATDRGIVRRCPDRPPDACTLVSGSGMHVLLIGDSNAAMLIATFTTIAQQQDLTLSAAVLGGCPWQRDLYTTAFLFDDCGQIKDDIYDRVIPALDPDLIIAMNLDYENPLGSIQYLGPDGTQDRDGLPDWIRQTTETSLAELESRGRVVVVLEPMPQPPVGFDPITCLSDASVVEACRFVADTQPTALEQLYREADRDSDRMWSVDLDRLACPYLPICDPIVDQIVVRRDAGHLTPGFAASLAPALTDYLTRIGALP